MGKLSKKMLPIHWRNGSHVFFGGGIVLIFCLLWIFPAQADMRAEQQQATLYLPLVAVQNVVGATELTPQTPDSYPAEGAEPPATLQVAPTPDCWTFVRFVNQSNAVVQIYWVTADDQEILYKTLGPGQSYWQQSYLLNVWRIRSTSGRLLRQVLTDSCERLLASVDAALFATPAPTPINCGKLVAFRLWDVERQQAISGYNPLFNNATLYLQQLPLRFTIRSDFDRQNKVESVKFSINGVSKIVNAPPYLYPDNLAGLIGENQDYTLTATAYAQDNAQGTVCETHTLVFRLTSAPSPTGGSIGDQIWLDLDGNGLQGDNEPGVAEIQVFLLDEDGNILIETTTDANGNYRFTNLAARIYQVLFVPPLNYAFARPEVGDNSALDSDANPEDGISGLIALALGEEDDTIDAGLESFDLPIPTQATALPTATPTPLGATPTPLSTPTPIVLTATPLPSPTATIVTPPTPTLTPTPLTNAIGNRVWRDDNANGVQDVGEFGLPGISIQLEDAQDNVLAITKTNTNGYYFFPSLQPNFGYFVKVILPPGYRFSPMDVGANDEIDSDMSPIGGFSGVIRLAPGEARLTVDAGLIPAASSLGDRVWDDTANANGIQDPGEPGVGGVSVKLFDIKGNTLSTQTTDSNGNYRFTDLPAATYYICITPPSGWMPTSANQGVDDTSDSDILSMVYCSDLFTVGVEPNITVDAGLIQP